MNDDINFEDAMKQLESIANELEKGNLTLDESVKKFEEGMNLSKKCNDFLESAEKKITILLEKDGDLNFKSHNEVLQDFYKILQAIGLKNNYLVNCYNLDSETLKEKEKVMIDKFGGNENLDGWKDCYFLYAVPKLNDKKVFTDVHGSSEKGTMITGEEIISIVTENGLQLLVVSNSINIVEELEKKEIMTENQAKEEIERQLGQLIVSEQYTIKSIALGYYPQFADTAHKEVLFYPAWKAVVLAEGDDTMRSSNDTAYSYEFSYMIDAQTGLEISEE